ncbi:G-type lectin S-receptor-like serine/threonine-protein kinase SD2-2 [Rutidosis leptorrhynchoides]|uniref:G-type lectin S-receptor-like serine/threonine-protein kinase SD2-2 n=1 Tax=Rutidosis leptorrhynchoides TaxID=125765 RepID=UPI003A993DFA
MVSLNFITLLLISTLLHFPPSVHSTSCLNPSSSKLIISGNSTISSENNTFVLGFFNTNDESKWYLGIWYASIPTPTYVWVANRETPLTSRESSSLVISDGKLKLTEYQNSRCDVVWQTDDLKTEGATDLKLLEDGNLVVTDSGGAVIWRSFDFPADTFLPGMNLTVGQTLTCWKSSNDPGLGRYLLRVRPPDYGEVELLYNNNNITNKTYWSSGNWTGNIFSGIPEMTLPYIYKFYFNNPFTETATFGYTEIMMQQKPLTRFNVDYTGQVKQYTWSPQTEFWNMFWSEPENVCRVYGLCGNLGFCNAKSMVKPCRCLDGFRPVDEVGWDGGDYSGGCQRDGDAKCDEHDEFMEIGDVVFDQERMQMVSGGKSDCEKKCLSDCECIGLSYNLKTNSCKNYFGRILNLGNSSSGLGIVQDSLSVRVSRGVNGKKVVGKTVIIVSAISCFLAILMIMVLGFLVLRKRMIKRKKLEEESVFPVTNLRVFAYKELHAATNGFSDQLGHGGFGAVFSGEVDSTLVAVKRLDRPGGGEKEFRAEVCTIGNIQHVNLVRLRGFCSEESERLLVYDYMPNGPLSSYLKTGGRSLDWDARFRIAIGTARGIAYLHEECRNCIIHCDIKPENILLDQEFSAKVSDFGLAKLIGRDFSRVLATMRGTWGYVAPEWISGVAITTKADVYSYGMTLLEILGGRRNVEGPPDGNGGESNEKWFFPPWAARRITEGDLAAVVDERLNGEYNMEEVVRVGLVAVWCIQDEEGSRPTMGMVVKMLEGVVAVEVPPPPKLLQALVSGESFHGVGGNSQNDTLSRVSVDSKD